MVGEGSVSFPSKNSIHSQVPPPAPTPGSLFLDSIQGPVVSFMNFRHCRKHVPSLASQQKRTLISAYAVPRQVRRGKCFFASKTTAIPTVSFFSLFFLPFSGSLFLFCLFFSLPGSSRLTSFLHCGKGLLNFLGGGWHCGALTVFWPSRHCKGLLHSLSAAERVFRN